MWLLVQVTRELQQDDFEAGKVVLFANVTAQPTAANKGLLDSNPEAVVTLTQTHSMLVEVDLDKSSVAAAGDQGEKEEKGMGAQELQEGRNGIVRIQLHECQHKHVCPVSECWMCLMAKPLCLQACSPWLIWVMCVAGTILEATVTAQNK